MSYHTADGSQVSTQRMADGTVIVASFNPEGGVQTKTYTPDEWREALLNGEIREP